MGFVLVVSLPFIFLSILLGFGFYFLGKHWGREESGPASARRSTACRCRRPASSEPPCRRLSHSTARNKGPRLCD
ncbi:hypothetical protein ZEAMMB73_Zm00001d034330 [Zea mays]|jgi:hypothetical protein|uniref:Uncharacterized protein n=1 Tax=Zea mays TaxID=4577 RepID=A0A1D6L6P1_MAIZE|nr:hypothetical protein ZEAMMB73_Zm00001d034330 [Zea mays]